MADNADALAFVDIQLHIAQSPERIVTHTAEQRFAQHVGRLRVKPIAHRHAFDRNNGLAHDAHLDCLLIVRERRLIGEFCCMIVPLLGAQRLAQRRAMKTESVIAGGQ